MTDQHPITPPPELLAEWKRTAPHPINEREHYHYITFCAARWGADQELEACCKWLERNYNYPQADHPLRVARRPKPPSLKEQALAVITNSAICDHLSLLDEAILRRALEALDD